MITQERVKHLLHYNPEMGIWTWLNPPSPNARLKGRQAGHRRPDGYRVIRIGGAPYYSSRLACLYMTGRMPIEEMDHIDRNPSNDRWANLREANRSQNKYNRVVFPGLRGVYRTGSRWWAQIGRSGYLGVFDTIEEAIAARDAAAIKLGGDFAILNGVI